MTLHTDSTMAEIAYNAGFSSPGYFSKCFRDKYGVSLSDIRKQKEGETVADCK